MATPRAVLPLAALGCVAGATAWAAVRVTGAICPAAAGPVYTVAALQAHVARHPTAWRGRTVLVHAIALPCIPVTTGAAGGPPSCLPPALIDPGPADPPVWLPLTLAAPHPLLAVLRHLRLVGPLLPAPPAVHWGAEATYRVQLRVVPADVCAAPPCDRGVLLDAAPSF